MNDNFLKIKCAISGPPVNEFAVPGIYFYSPVKVSQNPQGLTLTGMEK
jgi:hypothetical protein